MFTAATPMTAVTAYGNRRRQPDTNWPDRDRIGIEMGVSRGYRGGMGHPSCRAASMAHHFRAMGVGAAAGTADAALSLDTAGSRPHHGDIARPIPSQL
jgi:hypothetical protein